MSVISNLFGGHAPFKSLQTHMDVVHDAARELPALFANLLDGDDAEMREAAKRIFALEARADEVKHELRIHLPRSLFMPVDRRDLLQVLHHQDAIADRAEDIAGLLLQRHFEVPPELRPDLMAFVEQIVGVVALTHEVINLLDELVEVGFAGRVADRVEGLIRQINTAETATDKVERALMRTLFSLEGQISPVSVVLWYKILGWLGDVADHAETCANNIRLIIAR